MSFRLNWIVVLLLCGRGVLAEVTARSTEATRAAELISHLDDVDSAVRRRATLQLNSLGGEALPVVEAAASKDSLSPESRRRLDIALRILRKRAAYQKAQEAWIGHEVEDLRQAYKTAGSRSTKWDE